MKYKKILLFAMLILLLVIPSFGLYIRTGEYPIDLLGVIEIYEVVSRTNGTLIDSYNRSGYRIDVYEQEVCRTVVNVISTLINQTRVIR